MSGLTDREVTEYTAGLWRSRPVPVGEPEPAPEYVYSTVELPGGRITAARVRGRKHKHDGTNCDDWYELASFGEITCIAVSDGAGSAKFSRIGARESCKAAVNGMVRRLKDAFAERPELGEYLLLPLSDDRCMQACRVLAEVVQRSFLSAVDAVEAAWRKRSNQPAYGEPRLEDFAGTLLAALLLPVGGGECLAAACQVGDGVIALMDTKTGPVPSVKLMGVPDGGAFSGETAFLTSIRRVEALQSRTRIARCPADMALMMTDGVADDYFPPEPELPRLYHDLAANGVLGDAEGEASPGLRLKNWLDSYVERGSFDDRTLVIVSLRGGKEHGPPGGGDLDGRTEDSVCDNG